MGKLLGLPMGCDRVVLVLLNDLPAGESLAVRAASLRFQPVVADIGRCIR